MAAFAVVGTQITRNVRFMDLEGKLKNEFLVDGVLLEVTMEMLIGRMFYNLGGGGII